uniref:Uncharacterized protein n=1 Tax=Caenorhabditis japonica TaxID=281687 RepID=A0A8R1ISP3_CAEJA
MDTRFLTGRLSNSPAGLRRLRMVLTRATSKTWEENWLRISPAMSLAGQLGTLSMFRSCFRNANLGTIDAKLAGDFLVIRRCSQPLAITD